MTSIVVIGGGQAGATAIGKLRDEGYDGDLVLVGDEPAIPYERPPLSKDFLRGERDDHAQVRPEAWYAENAVDLRLGVRAERIDTAGRVVETADGSRIAFDHAVLATGSRNRHIPIPGIDLTGVFGLRSAADAERLRDAATGASKAVLVGMGFIGAEVAASLRVRGLEVSVIENAQTPLERVLGPELGGTIRGLHADHGVDMHFREGVERFEGDGRFEAVVTTTGRRIEGDLAVVGIGVQPNTELAEASGLAVDNGVVVDAALRTSADGVWAIGDVARHAHPVFGSVRVEHYDNAVKMGEHLGRTILGEPEVFDDPHWFWSDQYDANIQMAGFAMSWDEVVIRGSVQDRSFAAFLLKDGQLLSTFTMNWNRDVRRSMPLIRAQARPDPAQLADPDVDLRSLAKEAA
ncbi:MAG TPA: FAD-dependent oxidoreductase [Actinomycetota bacterium]|nr:FAD-dependent oxidoreductase [Actinomycetota bacterium]